MTAFNNIKTNNWPSASNDLEDFLVLELPLNDQAALTSSRRDIVAGRTVLHPKRTLTNTGASMAVATPTIYAANVKLHTYIYSTPSVLTVNGTTVPRGSAANGDVTYIVAVNGNLNTIAWSYDSGSGPYCYMKGIEVDYGDGNGYQLLTDGTTNYSNLISGSVESAYPLSNLFGGTIGSGYTNGTRAVNPGTLTLNLAGNKKHYDDNTDFGSTSEDKYLTVPASPDFSFGNDPWCIECWAYIRSTPGDGTAIWDFDTNVGYTTEEWICGYLGSGLVYFYWGSSSNYHGISTSYTANQWQHWAWTWDGTTARLFKDGTLAASSTTTYKSAGWGSATRDITIGKQNLGSRFGDQLIQDLRFYKGVAKYTANFTPPGAILG